MAVEVLIPRIDNLSCEEKHSYVKGIISSYLNTMPYLTIDDIQIKFTNKEEADKIFKHNAGENLNE